MADVIRTGSILDNNNSFKELLMNTVENPNESSFAGTGYDDNAYLFGTNTAPPLPTWG